MSIASVMPSSHLILCHPLLLLPSIFPSIRVFFNESVLHIRWPTYWSFSFSISPSNEYSGLISFRMDWFDLFAVQGLVSLGFMKVPNTCWYSLNMYLCVCVCVCFKSFQSCQTLCDPMDCRRPGSSVCELLQARILEWVAMPSSRGSSRTGDRIHDSYVSYIAGCILYQ